ncbi:FecR family protein [Marinospirillum perlucidum]|uniref:FecR family protein n=1 Tax=Marinospirillum perlucidum TaxID=1982602 RepID=UPI000DF39372|nr:FecR family protein [Marinospirillum perlucidum]
MSNRLLQSIKRTGLWLLVVSLLAGAQLAVAEPTQVGRVLAASAGATAQQPDQTPRDLQRRSPVYLGDTLRTTEEARMQLRMNDGEIFSLSAGSELVIEAFHYAGEDEETAAEESNIKRLVEGGLRTITGAVGGERYRIESRAGTIGVRGTSFYAFTQAGQNLYVRGLTGQLYLENEYGVAEFGVGETHNSARIAALGQAPQSIDARDLPASFNRAFQESGRPPGLEKQSSPGRSHRPAAGVNPDVAPDLGNPAPGRAMDPPGRENDTPPGLEGREPPGRNK